MHEKGEGGVEVAGERVVNRWGVNVIWITTPLSNGRRHKDSCRKRQSSLVRSLWTVTTPFHDNIMSGGRGETRCTC
jgi:hypothetical protein